MMHAVLMQTIQVPSILISVLVFRRLGDDFCFHGVQIVLKRVKWIADCISPLKAQMNSQKAGACLLHQSAFSCFSPCQREESSHGSISSELSTFGLQCLAIFAEVLCSFSFITVSFKSVVQLVKRTLTYT